jgi:hypothetical protein
MYFFIVTKFQDFKPQKTHYRRNIRRGKKLNPHLTSYLVVGRKVKWSKIEWDYNPFGKKTSMIFLMQKLQTSWTHAYKIILRFNKLPSKIKSPNVTRHKHYTFWNITFKLAPEKTWKNIQKLQMKKTNLSSQRGNNLKHKEKTNQAH